MSDFTVRNTGLTDIYKKQRSPQYYQRISLEQKPDEVHFSSRTAQSAKSGEKLAQMILDKISSALKIKLTDEELKTAQAKFQQIFLREDISLKDTKTMIKEYQEVEKIKDKKEYAKAVYELAKKNFGFGDIDLPLKFIGEEKAAGGIIGGKSHPTLDLVEINPNLTNVFSNIHHELRHTKQYYYSYCMDAERCAKDVTTSALRNAKSRGVGNLSNINPDNPDPMVVQYNIDKIKRRWGELTPEKVPQKYRVWASIMLDTIKDYVGAQVDENEYYEHMHEKDAYIVSRLANEIHKLVKTKII